MRSNVQKMSSPKTSPRENWFQYVRRECATAINFPCLITLINPMNDLLPGEWIMWSKLKFWIIKFINGTIRVIWSDPCAKKNNARFTTVPLKPWSDHNLEDIFVFLSLKVFYSDNPYSWSRHTNVPFVEKPQLKIMNFVIRFFKFLYFLIG